MTTAETKKRYRTPTHIAEAEFSLDDFSHEEILEYVRENGLTAGAGQSFGDLDTLDTLLLCGLKEEALQVISKNLSVALRRNIQL